MGGGHTAETDWNGFYSARAETMLAEVLDIVRIESPSRDAAGIRRVAEMLAAGLSGTGAQVEVVEEHPNGPNLLARYGQGGRPVLLVGHMDTVWPSGTLASMPAEIRGDIALGPGIFDMKAGCIVASEAIRGLSRFGKNPPITLLLTCDEEIGSASSRALIEREAREARCALVLEPPIPGGAAKTSRSGVARFVVRVRGRAAHAGVDPDKGVSAVAALAELVTALHGLNDLPNGLSVNVGTIRGGTRANVVAAEAEAEVDVRFRTAGQAERVEAAIRALRPTMTGAEVEILGKVDRLPLERGDATVALYERASIAAAASGISMGEGHVGGCSDGNLIAPLGVPVLDGLGVDGKGAHADHEQIVVADLPRRAAMLSRFLCALAGDR